MNAFFLRLILIYFLCFTTSMGLAASQNSGSAKPVTPTTSIQDELQKKTDQLQLKFEILDAAVKETRRDQLNYKVEKEIYKEIYSTQLSTVGIIGSLLLGIATILGIVGLKDLNELKLKYQNALNEFQKESDVAKKALALHSTELEALKASYALVISKNEVQDQKIRLLELLEKGGTFFKQRAFSHAAKYFELATEIDPALDSANQMLVVSLGRIGKFEEAIGHGDAYLKLNPADTSVKANIAEYQALMGNSNSAWSGSRDANRELEEYQIGILSYLKVVTAIAQKSILSTKAAILEDIAEHGNFVGKRDFSRWSFEDFEILLNGTLDPTLGQIGRHYIAALRGQLQTEELQELLTKTEA